MSKGKPTTRRYTSDERAQAVQLVRTLRAELGTEHGTVQRVASQLSYGTELSASSRAITFWPKVMSSRSSLRNHFPVWSNMRGEEQ